MGSVAVSGERRSLWRSRWAAVGAAVAVTLGGGGVFVANAATGVSSSVVTIDPVRILDTRDPVNIGLPGPFVSAVSQKLQVTGATVPAGATGVLLNVTVVSPTANGFLSIRPGDAAGAPSTSSLNFNAGDLIPNSVQVGLPTAGANAGKIDITYDAYGVAGPTTEVLIDVVGYLVAGAAGPTGPPGPAGSSVGGVDFSRVEIPPKIQLASTVLVTVVINAPQAGFVVVTSSFNGLFEPGLGVDCRIATSPAAGGQGLVQSISGDYSWQSVALTEGFAVSAGSTTFYLTCRRGSTLGNDVAARDANMTAVYSPTRL